jgi:hypothetical protein
MRTRIRCLLRPCKCADLVDYFAQFDSFQFQEVTTANIAWPDTSYAPCIFAACLTCSTSAAASQ